MYVDAGSTRNDTSPCFNSKRLVPMTETGSYRFFCKKMSKQVVRTYHSKSKSIPRESKKSYFFKHDQESLPLLPFPSHFGCMRVFIVSRARSYLC